jgi:signal transduction histidine kinase
MPGPVAEAVGDQLEDIRALLEDMSIRIRTVSSELHFSTLDHAGLLPALKEYGRQFASRSGMGVEVSGSECAPRLTTDKESVLFRIVQEALTNCAKHSKARSIAIALTHDAHHAMLKIVDDGVGFDPSRLGEADHTPGLGLLTMRERAEFAGGRFTLKSQLNKGTQITVEV